MRMSDKEQAVVRVFLNESDARKGFWSSPLYRVLLDRLLKEGFAGATLTRGVAGFGTGRTMHTVNLVEFGADLPMIIEVIEEPENVERLLNVLDEMTSHHTLVTVTMARTVRFAPRPPDKNA